jgi:DNA-3-methyladenine glycosylase
MRAGELRELLAGPAEEVAPRLLGMVLAATTEGVTTAVRLTEVEAYTPDDPASHSFAGLTPRNRSMFRRPGTLYVYRSYGIHWCANVVTGPEGQGAAVLLRAGEPVTGTSVMARRRDRADHLTDGPGRLCRALAVTGDHDGLDLLSRASPVRLRPGRPAPGWTATPRVGISRAAHLPWRFVEAGPPAGGE